MAEEAKGDGKGKRSLGGRLALVALLLLLCGAGIAGGIVLALGPSEALALLTGEDAPEGEETATDAGETEDPGGEDHADEKTGDDGHGGKGAAKKAALTVTPFKEIIVNINATTATGRKTSRFMKLNIALVYDEALPGADHVEGRRLYLRDSFQDYLRQLTERDLQGSHGLATVKNELLRRARSITESEAPRELLVSDLIVQ